MTAAVTPGAGLQAFNTNAGGTAVPVPATLGFMALGLLGLRGFRSRRA